MINLTNPLLHIFAKILHFNVNKEVVSFNLIKMSFFTQACTTVLETCLKQSLCLIRLKLFLFFHFLSCLASYYLTANVTYSNNSKIKYKNKIVTFMSIPQPFLSLTNMSPTDNPNLILNHLHHSKPKWRNKFANNQIFLNSSNTLNIICPIKIHSNR